MSMRLGPLQTEMAPAAMPTRLYMMVEDLPTDDARLLSKEAVQQARRLSPKLSGASARRFRTFYGEDFFGIRWQDRYVWHQEIGIGAFTMRRVAGKTIPMWVDDPTGNLRRQNPKAETRTTASGRRQVLIFRRAAKIGQRKNVRREGQLVSVPMSYPGAPGRIAVREVGRPYTTPGRRGGRIAQHNVGVRWRHPGLPMRGFLHQSLLIVGARYGLEGPIYATAGRGG